MAKIKVRNVDMVFGAKPTREGRVRVTLEHVDPELTMSAILSCEHARTIAETLGAAVATASLRKPKGGE